MQCSYFFWQFKPRRSYKLGSYKKKRVYMGAQSAKKLLPGGGPQGASLGGLIFMIKYNAMEPSLDPLYQDHSRALYQKPKHKR